MKNLLKKLKKGLDKQALLCYNKDTEREREVNKMYSRVIVNECGEIMEYVSDLTGAEMNEILEEHPEWKLKIMPIGE